MKKIQRILILLISLLVIWVLYSLVSHRIHTADEIAYDHVLKVLTYNTHGTMVNKSITEKKAITIWF